MCVGENNRTTKLSLKFLPNDIPTEAESVFNQYDIIEDIGQTFLNFEMQT